MNILDPVIFRYYNRSGRGAPIGRGRAATLQLTLQI